MNVAHNLDLEHSASSDDARICVPSRSSRKSRSLPRWLPLDIHILRSVYSVGGIRAARRAFPNRTDSAIYTCVSRQNIVRQTHRKTRNKSQNCTIAQVVNHES